MIQESTSFHFISAPCVFSKLLFGPIKGTPLAFIAYFGLKKVSLRAKTCFAIIEVNQNNSEIGFFVIPVG